MTRTFGWLRSVPAFIAAHKERLGIFGVGVVGNALMVWAFDYLLYPFVIWKLGILLGGPVMMLCSLVVCYLTIIFYDWAKKDWIGLETLKSLREYEGKVKTGRFTSWILKKGDWGAFLFFSLKSDPFITTVYMRKGAHQYNGMSPRDWKIFLGSVILSNLWWWIPAYTIAYTGGTVWEFLQNYFSSF